MALCLALAGKKVSNPEPAEQVFDHHPHKSLAVLEPTEDLLRCPVNVVVMHIRLDKDAFIPVIFELAKK